MPGFTGAAAEETKEQRPAGPREGAAENFLLTPHPEQQSGIPTALPERKSNRLFYGSGEKRPAGEADQGQREGLTMVQSGGKWEVPWAGESGMRLVPGGKREESTWLL